jgi:iron-sulfur cluster assembly accessory protein
MDTLQLRNEKAPAAPQSAPEPMENPVDLTAKAAEKVREIQAGEADLGAEYCLRLRVVGGGCSGFSYDLYFDLKQDDDQTFVSHDVNLIVDELSLQYLSGTTVDYVEGLQGAGFKFGNPNVKSTCCCGSSFSV